MKIGPHFADELEAAGLLGLPFSWGADGSISFDPQMSPEHVAAVQAVYAAHDPTRPREASPRDQAKARLRAAATLAELKVAIEELL